MMQTILALLAVTLFSSMTLSSYNNLLHRSDVMEASYLNLQGQEIVDSYFEKIECILLKGHTPSYVITNLKSTTNPIVDPTVTLPGSSVTYTFRVRNASLCDKSGDTSNSNNNNVIVTLVLTTEYGGRKITIGTPANPKTAIFSAGL